MGNEDRFMEPHVALNILIDNWGRVIRLIDDAEGSRHLHEEALDCRQGILLHGGPSESMWLKELTDAQVGDLIRLNELSPLLGRDEPYLSQDVCDALRYVVSEIDKSSQPTGLEG